MKSIIIHILFLFLATGCTSQTTMKHKYTNDLIAETSPYLLQHAHNPVNWKAWNNETLALAKKENKLLIISVGYSACHWCHVMEHESFENEEVAKIMNENFICIKVDREERPDVDQIYMDAVQLLKGNGGWPLNAVALPDGKPFWGGTYFPKDNWMSVLTQIADLWKNDSAKIKEHAAQLTQGIIQQNEIVRLENKGKTAITQGYLKQVTTKWNSFFDNNLGGYNRAPKFPMPNNYHYLLRHAVENKDADLLKFVTLTLTKMAQGGLYDPVGGGFARYSTDKKWHIPHFEKMLYDNGQLVSLYADAYLITKKPIFKEVVYETLAFVSRELNDKDGGFYASLDADSLNHAGENEEGAFYVWTKESLKIILKDDYALFKKVYNINSYGYWEKENYVLIRKESLLELSKSLNLDLDELKSKIQTWKTLLYKERAKRERPGLDDKTLTSWNAIMLKGYIDAYRVFDDASFLKTAVEKAEFLTTKLLQTDGSLHRTYKNNTSKINAYLEDYALLIDALTALHEVTLEEKWLEKADKLTAYTLIHFFDSNSGYFYFTSDKDAALITRKIDLTDNVIPSGNSIMAKNLFKLGHYYANTSYIKKSENMLAGILDKAENYPPSYSNWLQLASDFANNYYEIALVGENAIEKLKEINSVYIPNKLISGSIKSSTIPLLENRFIENETLIYICIDAACQLPTANVKTALKQMAKK